MNTGGVGVAEIKSALITYNCFKKPRLTLAHNIHWLLSNSAGLGINFLALPCEPLFDTLLETGLVTCPRCKKHAAVLFHLFRIFNEMLNYRSDMIPSL